MSNVNINKSVNWIANNGLCSGCGTCQSICPVGCIEISLKEDGQFRPEIDPSVCTNCGLCTKVCPFSSLHYKKGIERPIASYSGYSSNSDIRYNASSGGLVTQLLIEGLKSGTFDAVVVVSGHNLNDFKSVILTDPEEVLLAKGSKYVQVPVNILLNELENTSFQKIAYVGLPCHIRSLKKYLGLRKKFSARIALVFSLVCGQTLKWIAVEKQLKSLKVEKNRLKKYTFRGNGWPGSQKIEINKKVIEIPHTSRLAMGGLFSSILSGVDACIFCDDHFGKDSDISFCDAWHFRGKGNCDGISTALCYSKRGQKFLMEASGNKSIIIKKDNFEKVLKVQGHMKPTGSVLFLLKLKNIRNKIILHSEINSNCFSIVGGLVYFFAKFFLSFFPYKHYPVCFLGFTRGFKKFLKF
ncbi:Coenzyme F420 hydrogenase/dehydrogenase, beta subunit C-terminal domain [Thermophagus sp. OGC60D27]|uniref:Coenzyme F420 hydrogenase/dehydrogenase, beta subunit C-terminal domain n=1 Tax=Thermophagus sp. OGC60D27 TaxID=3458415 RepID=UPI00403777E0